MFHLPKSKKGTLAMNTQNKEITAFIPYYAHSGLAEFTDIYLGLQRAVADAIAAKAAWHQAKSEMIPWEVFHQKFPTDADKKTKDGQKLWNLMNLRAIAAARAETLWIGAPHVLYQARAKMDHVGLARLSRQLGKSIEAERINATFNPSAQHVPGTSLTWEQYTASNVYRGTFFPQGMTVEELDAIKQEPLWRLETFEHHIAVNNFICGVNLAKRAERVWDRIKHEALSLQLRRLPLPPLSQCLTDELKEALAFYQTIPALRDPYSEVEALADL
jgi:hypothetical protein